MNLFKLVGGYVLRSLTAVAVITGTLSSGLYEQNPLPQPAHETKHQALQIIEEACVQCHDMVAVFSQKKSKSAWERTITEMMWRGAQMLPGEAETVRDYLASGYNLAPPTAAAGQAAMRAEYLPEGAGKSLVLRSCVPCHDLSIVSAQKKNHEEWRRSVESMVRLGMRLNPAEIETVIDYLSKSFAP